MEPVQPTIQRIGMQDTTPELEAIRAAGFRKMDSAKKFRLMDSLSTSMSQHAMQALRDANPRAGSRSLRLLFVEKHYGKFFADEVKGYLESREDR